MKKYYIVLLFSIVFILSFPVSLANADTYQSCTPGVLCTLNCYVGQTYYFAAYDENHNRIIYASCTGHSDKTCTFSRTNDQDNNYHIECAGSSGGGGGGNDGPSCETQHILGDSEWGSPFSDRSEFNKDEPLPLIFTARSTTSVIRSGGGISISFGRWGWQNPPYEDITEYMPGPDWSNCPLGGTCVFQRIPPDQCPNNPTCDSCCVRVNLQDIMPALRNIISDSGKGGKLTGGWQLKIEVKPSWGETCTYRKDFTITDCDSNCPTPLCTVTNDDCNRDYTGNYTLVNTGDYCKAHIASCKQTNGCGNEINCNKAQCYKIETNTNTIPDPTFLRIKVDNVTSTNLEKLMYQPKTIIKEPLNANSPTAIITSHANAPSGARLFGTKFYYMGALISDKIPMDATDPIKADYPPAVDLMKKDSSGANNATGSVGSQYYATNKCNDTDRESNLLVGWYRVNRLPNTIIDITPVDAITTRGCETESRWTGLDTRNPLTFTFRATDPDDNTGNFYKGVQLWLTKKGTDIPVRNLAVPVTGAYTDGTDIDEIGILVTDASNVRFIQKDGTSYRWAVVEGDNPYILKDSQNRDFAKLTVGGTATGTGGEVTKSLTLEFIKNNPNILPEGKYRIYGAMQDTYQIYEDDSNIWQVESKNLTNAGEWNFDFKKPTIRNKNLGVENPNEQRILKLDWISEDNILGGIRPNHTVVNIFKTGATDQPFERTMPISPEPNKILPGGTEHISQRGMLHPLQFGWIHPTSDSTYMKVNIGNNTDGNLHFYITVYDKACNYTDVATDEVSLSKWIATKGGIFYSKGTVNYPTKPLDKFYNLGTELISSGSNSINTVINYTDPNQHMNPAVAKGITDINNRGGYYNELKKRFEQIKPTLKSVQLIAGPTIDGVSYTLCHCPAEACLFQPFTDTIRENIIYNGKIILIPPQGKDEINIKGSIRSSDNDTDDNHHAFFVFSDGNINIGGSARTTGSTLYTDRIDAFLIAKNYVNILPEAEEGGFHDAVLVNGGIVAFGDVGDVGPAPAFSLKRTLGLYNPLHPVLNVMYHPKYAVFSDLFFGLQVNAYKREVGFKPL